MDIDFGKIGSLIKEMRESRNITRSEFAEDIGVSEAAVAQWENGTNGIKTEKLYDIAQFFDISLTELISGKRKQEDLKSYLIRNYNLAPYRNINTITNKNLNEVRRYIATCKNIITRFNEIYPRWLSDTMTEEEKEVFEYLKVNYDIHWESVSESNNDTSENQNSSNCTDWERIRHYLRRFNDKSKDEQDYEKWKVLKFRFYISQESIIGFVLKTGKDKLFKDYLTTLTKFDKNILLSEMIEGRTPSEIQDYLPLKCLIEDGAECLYYASDFAYIHYSKENINDFEGPFVKNVEKTKVAESFDTVYPSTWIGRLTYDEYQVLISKTKTDGIKSIITLRKNHPNQYVGYLRKAAVALMKE